MAASPAKASFICALAVITVLAAPLAAQSYRVTVQRLDANVYQAAASRVIIETRACGDLGLAEEPEEAILNWEGSYGRNWLLFTSSKTRCDVVAIR